jgi:hypothetical protein
MKRQFKTLTLALILFCGLALTAHASTIEPFPITKWVSEGGEAFIEPLDIEAGTYKATIVDHSVPEPFDTLLFAIISKTGTAGWVDGAGSTDSMFNFDADSDVDYFAAILAIAGDGGIGLFSADVTHVPIPPTLLLLGSGLVSLVVLRRRRG